MIAPEIKTISRRESTLELGRLIRADGYQLRGGRCGFGMPVLPI
jgi:hypothetical protein